MADACLCLQDCWLLAIRLYLPVSVDLAALRVSEFLCNWHEMRGVLTRCRAAANRSLVGIRVGRGAAMLISGDRLLAAGGCCGTLHVSSTSLICQRYQELWL